MFKNKGILRISTLLAVTTSILVAMSTVCVGVYALFFLNSMFGYVLPHDELYSQLLLFKNGLLHLVFAFLVFGLIGTYYMTKVIVRPMEELIKQLEVANKELKSSQVMVVHSEKMRSLGQLVAGITHEINNPINFVYGNLIHLKNYSNALLELIEAYQISEAGLSEDKKLELAKLKDKIELDFIKEDLPMLIKSCQDGTERTKNIILDLKNFSRLDEMVVNNVDLEKEIETILNILQNKIKHKIEIVKEYEAGIQTIEGYGGQLNQVFMNILDNACYAIKDSGKIFIRLVTDKSVDKGVIIEFEDTGTGMTSEQLAKIFEPFYTTKPVGEGSGLGMSISYKVIQNHNGKISVDSVVGKGTIFKIQLPIKMATEMLIK